MRQLGMDLERCFVDLARMDVEQARIAGRAIGANRHAAGLLARRSNHLAQRRRDRRLLALAGMEAGKDEQLHGLLAQIPAHTGCSDRNTPCWPKRLVQASTISRTLP